MITVTGSLAFDHIMDFEGRFADHIMPDKIHQINLSFLVNNLNKQKGGNAGNIAYNLALLKTPVSILGTAGTDFADYAAFLKNNGVDTSRIKISDNALTSSAFIMTDLSDNQITAFYAGAMKENSTLSLGGITTDLVVIAPNDPKAMIKFTKQCQELNLPYLLDPGMQLPVLEADDLEKMLSQATILIGNDYEMELLRAKCPVQSVDIIITTLGEKGSVIQTKDQTIQVSAAKPLQVIDPTGAGDAYRAGFLAGYINRRTISRGEIKGLDLQVCGQMGSVAACYAIEKYGTSSHKFTVQEFRERYKENFGDEIRY